MITLDALAERFGPERVVAPYGKCIVVPGVEFNPDWEAELDDQGIRCFFSDLDGVSVALVRLQPAVVWRLLSRNIGRYHIKC